MSTAPKKGVRERMTEEIKAEIARQPLPDGVDATTLDELTKSMIDAMMGLRSGRIPNDRRAAESIVTKLSQLIH